MAEILVFTVLATLVAVYSILPEYRQLRVGYSFGRRMWIIVGLLATGILLLYIASLYVDHLITGDLVPVSILGFQTVIEASKLFFLIEVLQIAVSIAISGIFLAVFLRDPPTIRNPGYLADKMRGIRNENEFSTLVSVLEDNYDALIRNQSDSIEPVDQYTETLLLDPEFAEQHSLTNPYFEIQLIEDDELESFPRHEAVDLYLQALVRNSNSIFYREIRNNKHRIDTNRYEIPESNQLLYAMLSDCNVAHELRVYKPIGDTIIQLLQEQRKQEQDDYNNRQSTFSVFSDSDEVFQDPVFTTIRFFDIMVSESLYQGMNTHMWLYYYTHFTDNICENFEITDYSRPNEEFANDYAYLLYAMFSNLEEWIELADRNPGDISMDLQSVSPMVENGDILKSSIRCLVQCHRHILVTSEIPDRFKRERTESLFKTYFKLASSSNQTAQDYGEVLLLFMEEEMQSYGGSPPQYRMVLEDIFSSIEHELRIKEPRNMTLVNDIKSRFNF